MFPLGPRMTEKASIYVFLYPVKPYKKALDIIKMIM